jgi:MoaA/NifB/PqqE/SkfB family radical SAM enzyme
MTGLCLGPGWDLCVCDNRAYVQRRKDLCRVAALSAAEAVAVGLMDGKRADGVVAELMQEIAGAAGVLALTQVKKRLGPLLKRGGHWNTGVPLEDLAAVFPPDVSEGLRPLPGPRVLHWWVTDVCPRRCSYCFADPEHGSHAYDASLSRGRLKELFSEAASLGTTELLVAGGEPFLRADLVEVLADAIECGISPGITTKHPIGADLARELAQIGLGHICLSVDSFSPKDNATLVGSRTYPEQVRSSAKHLAAAGVAFSFECVLTRLNWQALDGVVAEAQALGARVVQVVPFEAVRRPIGPYRNEDLLLPAHYRLDETLTRLGSRYKDVRVEKFERLGEGARAGFNCDVGMTKLLFTSAGKVHRCYKLMDDPALYGADLNEVSVAEAWHGPEFRHLISPSQSDYAGSACSTCSRFASCNRDGRCVFQSHFDYGSYFSPDRSCSGPYTCR